MSASRSSPLRLIEAGSPGLFASNSDVPATLSEASLFYDPPYATPLDDALAWHLVKYLAPSHGLRYRVDVLGDGTAPDHGVDFVVEHGDRRTGLLVEGPDDDRLDGVAARVLATGHVDVLYRVRTSDVLYRLHDLLLLMSRWDPSLFAERGRTNLGTLASPDAQSVHPRRGTPDATVHYTSSSDAHACALVDTDERPSDTLHIERLMRPPSRPHDDAPHALWRSATRSRRLARSA